jgi:hypothetical protein
MLRELCSNLNNLGCIVTNVPDQTGHFSWQRVEQESW